ncbi:MAG: trigger factor [Gammaproteobacteria bacterium]|nr:MAG: trigger factor [Gammaproteobacteria bacterium]TND05008.1 MAG: trigger factor [Gammaproteobacteria bacterium]
MQVSVTTTQGLERRMTVEIPAERIESEIQARLKSMVRTARVAGFRPGKTPLKVIERKYGPQVRDDVVSDVVQSSFSEAVVQESLRPAGTPKIGEVKIEPGKPLAYTATFEVYPTINSVSLEGITISRPTADITEQDVDEMLEKMRRQRATWAAVDRTAADADRVTIDFVGNMSGEPFAGNTAENYQLVLGSGAMIPGFEDRLTGAAAGDALTLDLTFPADYHVVALAGQPVQFKVTVRTVEAARLPEIDEEFAKTFGVADGNVDTMREEMKKSMAHEQRDAIKTAVRAQVMDALAKANAVEVPQALVDQETNEILARFFGRMGIDPARAAKLNIPRETVEVRARRTVGLRLILAETMRQNNIKVTPEALRAAVESFAQSYDNPEEVVKWYYADRKRLADMEAVTLEQQLVDWILARVTVNDQPTTFAGLIKRRQSILNEQAS